MYLIPQKYFFSWKTPFQVTVYYNLYQEPQNSITYHDDEGKMPVLKGLVAL